MSLAISTLRPSIMVVLSTSCRGNTHYQRIDLEEGRARSKWETTKTVADPDEQERALKVQAKASALVRGVCVSSAFGLFCPEANADLLEAAVKEAEELVAGFNRTAKLTRVRLYVMTGVIAADDVEAMKKISREVRELMDDMTSGIKNMDVKLIREAAAQAKEVSGMLTPTAQANVQIAIDTARQTATAMNKLIKAGEQAAIEIDQQAIRKIKSQRTAFLDIGEEEVKVSKPKARGRAVDFA